jgi:hypothetical protein
LLIISCVVSIAADEVKEMLDKRSTTRAPATPPTLVSLSLDRKEVKAAKNEKRKNEKLHAAGLKIWSEQQRLEKVARRDALEAKKGHTAAADGEAGVEAGAEGAVAAAAVAGAGAGEELTDKEEKELAQLVAAIATQVHTRAVQQAGIDAAAAYANQALSPMQQLLAAYAIGAAVMPARAALFFNKTRLDVNTTAARARQRVLDASVAQVINFASAQTLPNVDASAARLPVIYVGDRANNRKASRGFAMQRFLHLLARKAIVVICSEHRTTKCCGDCGHFNVQPRKAYSAVEHRGTKYCANLECPSRGRFTNRDVQAACNIVDRFICAFMLGGSLGLRGVEWIFSFFLFCRG